MAETFKARICVAVGRKKEWSAAGWGAQKPSSAYSEQTMQETALDMIEEDVAYYAWVEVDLPTPKTLVLPGTVVATLPPDPAPAT